MKKSFSDLNQLQATEELKHNTFTYIHHHRKVNSLWKWGTGLVTIGVLALLIFLPLQGKQIPPAATNQKAPYAYVTFDVNPSIELILNKENQVIKAKSYNADGEAILKELNITNQSFEQGVNTLLNNERFQTYMQDGYLQVSVYSRNQKHSNALEKEIDTTLSSHYETSQFGSSCVSKQEHDQASSHHMSGGKYQVIEMILKEEDAYTLDQLKDKSMKELKILYEELTGNSFNNGNQYGNHHGERHNTHE